MALTRSQIVAQVLLNLQHPTTSTLRDQIEDVWLPLVLHRIADSRWWDQLETVESAALASTDNEVTLPSDIRKLINVRIDNGDDSKTISPISPTEFDRWEHSTIQGASTTGEPLYCCRFGEKLEFSPLADQAYTVSVRYLRSIDEMATDGATCEIPGIDDILVAELTAHGYMQLQNHEQYAVWKATAKRLWQEHDGEIDGTSPVMRLYNVRSVARGPDRWYLPL